MTCKLIQEIMKEAKHKLVENSILNDVNELINLEGDLDQVNNNCNIFLNEIKKEHKKRLNDPVVAELNTLHNNRFIDRNEIENIIFLR
jgi:hypothetical protein